MSDKFVQISATSTTITGGTITTLFGLTKEGRVFIMEGADCEPGNREWVEIETPDLRTSGWQTPVSEL